MRCTLQSGLLVVGLLSALPSSQATADFKQHDGYAVVIGISISQYREELFPKVLYAVKDAEAVAKLLETQAGVPKSPIRLMAETKARGTTLPAPDGAGDHGPSGVIGPQSLGWREGAGRVPSTSTVRQAQDERWVSEAGPSATPVLSSLGSAVPKGLAASGG